MFGRDADGHFIPVYGFMQLKLFFSQVTFAKPKSSQNSSIGKSYSLQKKFHTRAPLYAFSTFSGSHNLCSEF